MPPLFNADSRELTSEQRVFHQLAATIEMLFHSGFGSGGVATRDRVNNLKVRRRRALLKGTELDAE